MYAVLHVLPTYMLTSLYPHHLHHLNPKIADIALLDCLVFIMLLPSGPSSCERSRILWHGRLCVRALPRTTACLVLRINPRSSSADCIRLTTEVDVDGTDIVFLTPLSHAWAPYDLNAAGVKL